MNIDKAIRETENKLALLKAAKAVIGNGAMQRVKARPRGKQVPIMQDERKRARSLKQNGLTIPAIASKIGRSESAVWNILNR